MVRGAGRLPESLRNCEPERGGDALSKQIDPQSLHTTHIRKTL